MKKLETITAEQLQSAPYLPVPFLVDELLPESLHILAGAPKIGKSWLALWLCLCVAQGQALWNKLIYQKVRRFICSVLQIFCCDGFQFGHFFTSFPFAIDILCFMV